MQNWFFVDVKIKGDTHTIVKGTKIKSVDGLFTDKKDECKNCVFGVGCSNVTLEEREEGQLYECIIGK